MIHQELVLYLTAIERWPDVAQTNPAFKVAYERLCGGEFCWILHETVISHFSDFEQWSVRPYRQLQGCDGTTCENIHLIALRMCQRLGLDYAALYCIAYPDEREGYAVDLMADWVRSSKSKVDHLRIESMTIVPRLSAKSLRRLLWDLRDINARTLAGVLEQEFASLGYDMTGWENEK